MTVPQLTPCPSDHLKATEWERIPDGEKTPRCCEWIDPETGNVYDFYTAVYIQLKREAVTE